MLLRRGHAARNRGLNPGGSHSLMCTCQAPGCGWEPVQALTAPHAHRMFATIRQFSKLVKGCDDPNWDCEINVNVRLSAHGHALSCLP